MDKILEELENYPEDIEILYINSLCYDSILDLNKFNSISELICTFRNITGLINLPKTIKKWIFVEMK